MKIIIEITNQPIEAPLPDAPGCGAFVEFRGNVRPEESGRGIEALVYEAYEPMAKREIERIVREIGTACEAVQIVHRIGTIPVGETAILVQAASRHRGEAFALLTAFMDRLKQDVPIWKTEAIHA